MEHTVYVSFLVLAVFGLVPSFILEQSFVLVGTKAPL